MEEKKWKEDWRQRTCPCCEMSRKSRASNGFYIFWIGSQDAKTKDHTYSRIKDKSGLEGR